MTSIKTGISILQQRLFLYDYFPEYVMNPQEANFEFQRGKVNLYR